MNTDLVAVPENSCIFCHESIQAKAKVCKHCGRSQNNLLQIFSVTAVLLGAAASIAGAGTSYFQFKDARDAADIAEVAEASVNLAKQEIGILAASVESNARAVKAAKSSASEAANEALMVAKNIKVLERSYRETVSSASRSVKALYIISDTAIAASFAGAEAAKLGAVIEFWKLELERNPNSTLKNKIAELQVKHDGALKSRDNFLNAMETWVDEIKIE